MTIKVDELLAIRNQIIHRYSPEKIVLYGSYAHGTYTDNSDLDLLIVMSFDGKAAEVSAEIAAAIEAPTKLDVAVCTPQDFAASLGRAEWFLTYHIVKRGLVLYEKSAAGTAATSRSSDPPTHS